MMPIIRIPVVLAVLLLAACVPHPVVEKPIEAPRPPARTVEGAAHYRVVQKGTQVYARVFRAGRLAKLGHNHVVEFHGVTGDIYLADDIDASLFDLAVASADATVDDPELRQSQGADFLSKVSDDARAGTRGNMLGEEVLDAAKFPYVTMSSTKIEGSREHPRVTLNLTLKGVTRQVTTLVSMQLDGDRLVAQGQFDILQSDFGIEPYSVLGGALKVEDQVDVVFTVAAAKVE